MTEPWISEDGAVMAGVVAEERRRRGRWLALRGLEDALDDVLLLWWWL